MADVDAGSVTYKIKGDTSELKKELKNAVAVQEKYAQQIKKTTDELNILKATEEQMKSALKNGEIAAKEYEKYEKQVKETEASLKILTMQHKAALDSAGTLSQEINKLSRNMDDAAKEIDDVSDSSEKAADSLDDAADSALKMEDVLKAEIIAQGFEKVIDILYEGAKALKGFAEEGIELASDLQEVQNVVDVTFGENNNKIYEFADTAAEKFGLSKYAAQQYSGTMGALFKSSGITEGIADMSTAIAGLSADMASFYNLDANTAFEKIRSGISGETEPLKQLGINMSVANLEAYALAQGIEKSYNEMSQAEQVLLRYNYLMTQTADAQGDFARTSDNYANQQRILQMNIETAGAEMGEQLLPAVNELFTMLNKHMPEIREAAKYLGGELADSLEVLTEKAESFIDNGGLEKGIDCLIWIVDNGDKIITVGTGITALLNADKFEKSAKAVGGIVDSLKSFVGLEGGVTSLGGSIASAGTSAVTAASGFSAVAAAMMAAAIAAEAIKDVTVDKWYEELDAHEQKINDITDETLAINDETKALNKLADAQSAAYNPVEARKQALEGLAEYNERRKEIEAELRNVSELSGLNSGNSDYAVHLRQQKMALETELEAIETNRAEKLKIINSLGAEEIAAYEKQQDAYNRYTANLGKTSADAVAAVWENIAKKTDEKMSELDEEYAKHNLTRQEYLAQGIAYLETHRNEDSAAWWGYYDSLTAELAQMGEEEARQIAENAKKVQEALKDSLEQDIRALEIRQLEEGLSDEWFYNEWEKLIADLDKNSDLYLDNYKKILEGRNKLQEESGKAALSEAEDLQKSYEKIISQRDSLADSISVNASTLFNTTTETDKRTGEQTPSYDLQIAEYERKMAAKRQLTSKIAELYKKNAPDELVRGLLKLDPEAAVKYANQLLNSPEKLSRISAGLSYDSEISTELANLVTSHSDEYYSFGEEMGANFGEGFREAFSKYASPIDDMFANGMNNELSAKMTAANASVGYTAAAAVRTAAYSPAEASSSARYTAAPAASSEKIVVLDSVNGTWLATVINSANKQHNIITGG